MFRRRLLALAALLVAAGCVGGGDPAAEPLPSATATEFLPGLQATVLEPTDPAATSAAGADAGGTLVVLVPGGGWTSADPSGLLPLARALAERGITAATITYRTSAEGSYFPQPAQDVACGVAAAVGVAGEAGLPPSRVVVLGHSAGAQLAALVALAPQRFTSDECPYPPVEPDALIGLAGPYDVQQAEDAAVALFGPRRPDVADWAVGNPVLLAQRRPGLDVLLLHGRADSVVPPAATDQFAFRLQQGGHDAQTVYVQGADHASIYSAEVAAPIITTWVVPVEPSPSPRPD